MSGAAILESDDRRIKQRRKDAHSGVQDPKTTKAPSLLTIARSSRFMARSCGDAMRRNYAPGLDRTIGPWSHEETVRRTDAGSRAETGRSSASEAASIAGRTSAAEASAT